MHVYIRTTVALNSDCTLFNYYSTVYITLNYCLPGIELDER